jgi:hypothetical protein
LQNQILALFMACSMSGYAWAETQVEAPDIHVGDSWHYRTVDGFTNETTLEFTHRVVEVNEHEIVIQLQNKNAKGTELRYYNRDWNSLDVGNTKFDPYYPAFKFPMGVGVNWRQEFRSTTTSGQSNSAFMNGKTLAFEKVTVPAGVFDAYRIESDIESHSTDANANSSKGHKTTWYAPAIKNYIRSEVTVSSEGRVRSKSVNELVEYSLQNQAEKKN